MRAAGSEKVFSQQVSSIAIRAQLDAARGPSWERCCSAITPTKASSSMPVALAQECPSRCLRICAANSTLSPANHSSERSSASRHALRIGAHSFASSLGRAEACRRDHLFDLDGGQPPPAHGLRWAAGGQASRAGSAEALAKADRGGQEPREGDNGADDGGPCRNPEPEAAGLLLGFLLSHLLGQPWFDWGPFNGAAAKSADLALGAGMSPLVGRQYQTYTLWAHLLQFSALFRGLADLTFSPLSLEDSPIKQLARGLQRPQKNNGPP